MGKSVMEIRADFTEFGQMVATMYAAGALLTDEEMASFMRDDIIAAIGILALPEIMPSGAFKLVPTPAFREKFLQLAKIVAGRMEKVQ